MKKLLIFIACLAALTFAAAAEMVVLDDGMEVFINPVGVGVSISYPGETRVIDYEGDSLEYDYLMELADSLGVLQVSYIGTPGYIEHPDPAFTAEAAAYWLDTFVWAVSADSLDLILYDEAGGIVRVWPKRTDTGSRTDLNNYPGIMLKHCRQYPLGRVSVNGFLIYNGGD